MEMPFKTSHEPKSNFIKKIEYSCMLIGDKKNTERISVHFKDGGHFEYTPPLILPPAEPFDFANFYEKFITSESVGKFWYKEINDKFQLKVIRKRLKGNV